jgi:hypothetical protein
MSITLSHSSIPAHDVLLGRRLIIITIAVNTIPLLAQTRSLGAFSWNVGSALLANAPGRRELERTGTLTALYSLGT